MSTTHPTLYKRNSNGSTQQWTISVEGSTIIKEYGQVGGALQTATDTITEGKNIGRSNETTPEQQAEAEALSQWEIKQKKGYNIDIDAARSGDVDAEFVAGGVDPMLAHPYAKRGKDIRWPAYAQPKLDGHRCIAMVALDGAVTLWSRTRKLITGVPHIARAIESMEFPPGTILDGELYNHDYREKFEELTSFIRQETPKPGHEVVQYHIYDVVDETKTFSERVGYLPHLWAEKPDCLVLVETVPVESYEELQERFSEWLSDGYEGAMVRNKDSLYVGKRSKDLQKVKEFDDAEFEVVKVEAGRGRMAGKAIFVCVTGEGKEFAVKMKGSLDSLIQYVDDPSLAIGRLLTVQYQGLTTYGLPRFPIGLRLREDV